MIKQIKKAFKWRDCNWSTNSTFS